MRAQTAISIYFPFVALLSELAAAAGARVGVRAGGRRHHDASGTLIAFVLYLDSFFTPIQQLSQVFDSYQQAQVGLRPDRRTAGHPDLDPAAAAPGAGARARRRHRRDGCRLPVFDRRSAAAAPGADRRRPADRAGRDRRRRRGHRRREVDPGQADRPVLRRHLRIDPRRRHRRPRASTWAPTGGGSASCRRSRTCSSATVRDNIAYGRPDATDAEVEAAARAVGALAAIAGLAGRFRHPVARAGPEPVRRAAAADLPGPRRTGRPGHPAARRGDGRARPGGRVRRAGRDRPAGQRPDHGRRRAPADHRRPGRPHRGDGPRPDRRDRPATTSCCAVAAPTRGCTPSLDMPAPTASTR